MWRALVFIGLLALAAFAAVWLADRPGTVVVTWSNYEARTTVAVAAVLLAATALLLAMSWTVVQFFMGLPGRLGSASRQRRRTRGYQAVSRGMVAVGAGDPLAARRYASEAERLLGREPLALLLKAQAAQVSGDRNTAETAFRRMLEESETRVLGLRGLFVEARRRGDTEAARSYAEEAARLAPAATWANDAILESQVSEGNWRKAIDTLERRSQLGLVDRATLKRHKAVLLTADAQARLERDPEGALESAQQAVKLAPDLVPAASLTGRLLSRRGDLRRAAKVVRRAWRIQPHPELAETYLNLRPGDSALDRLNRAETLAKDSSWAPESRLAVARVALEAREFKRARQTLEPLLQDRPTVRVCLLMADIEQAEHGNTGRSREWLARATRAPRDPAWIADGMVSDKWAPISPVSGRLDAFVWQAPPELLGASDESVVETGEDERKETTVSLPPAQEKPSAWAEEPVGPSVSTPTIVATSAPPETVKPETPFRSATDHAATGGRLPNGGVESGQEPVTGGTETIPAKSGAPEGSLGANGAAKAEGAEAVTKPEPATVAFPLDHAPDDPGPEKAAAKPARFKLFG